MERLRYRSTSLIDLQAELHEADLLRDARSGIGGRPRPPRRRGLAFGLRRLMRRISG
jgi:hypothetical protein